MKYFLEKLYHHYALSADEAKDILLRISGGAVPQAQVASFMTVYLMRSIEVEELKGFRDALLELCTPFEPGIPVIDLCGTGGDGKNTFNISTLASFVVASCGIKVAKHGNYGMSSVSGSSNVLEELSCRFTNHKETLKKQLYESNICFMHAPLFHPALKQVALVRRELGVRTFFNMLGPLVNPARPTHRLAGVFNSGLGRMYHYLLQGENAKYTVVHSVDGYDEISGTAAFKVFSNNGEQLVHPSVHQMNCSKQSELSGGHSKREAAQLFMTILEGKGNTAQNNAVILNAAYALQCATEKTIEQCIGLAKENLLNGNAGKTFKKFIQLN